MRIMLRKKVAALYRMSRHVVGPITPDAERSARGYIPVIQRSTLAPQCKRRARDAAVHLAVVYVLRKVECRCGAIFFANCMHSCRITQRSNIGGTHLRRKTFTIRTPCCQRVVHDCVRARRNHPLRQRLWLCQQRPRPIAKREAHVGTFKYCSGWDDIEHGEPRDAVRVIESHAICDAPAAIMAR